MTCSRCGVEIGDEMKFCPSCGQATGDAPSSPVESGPGQETAIPSIPEAQSEVPRSAAGWQTLHLVGTIIWIVGAIAWVSVLLFGWIIPPFFVGITTGLGVLLDWLARKQLQKSYRTEALSQFEMECARVTADSVQTACSRMEGVDGSKFIMKFTPADVDAIHGLKLANGEYPIILFGTNSHLCPIAMLGWSGVLFTSQGVHFRLTQGHGFMPYDAIRQIALFFDGEEGRLVVNFKPLGRLVTSMDASKGLDPTLIQALTKFCDNINILRDETPENEEAPCGETTREDAGSCTYDEPPRGDADEGEGKGKKGWVFNILINGAIVLVVLGVLFWHATRPLRMQSSLAEEVANNVIQYLAKESSRSSSILQVKVDSVDLLPLRREEGGQDVDLFERYTGGTSGVNYLRDGMVKLSYQGKSAYWPCTFRVTKDDHKFPFKRDANGRPVRRDATERDTYEVFCELANPEEAVTSLIKALSKIGACQESDFETE